MDTASPRALSSMLVGAGSRAHSGYQLELSTLRAAARFTGAATLAFTRDLTSRSGSSSPPLGGQFLVGQGWGLVVHGVWRSASHAGSMTTMTTVGIVASARLARALALRWRCRNPCINVSLRR